MQKTLTLMFITIFLISCSKNDDSGAQQNSDFPTNLSLSTETIGVGDILTINGNGFLTNETYIVTFSDNTIGSNIEINPDNLKVEVPANAINGNISLTFNGETEIVGFLTINDIIQSNIFLYRSNFGNSPATQEITLLNPADGSEQFLTTIPLASTDAFDFIYYEPTNELLGIDQDDDELIKVNLNTNQVSTIQFTNQNIDYHQLANE